MTDIDQDPNRETVGRLVAIRNSLKRFATRQVVLLVGAETRRDSGGATALTGEILPMRGVGSSQPDFRQSIKYVEQHGHAYGEKNSDEPT